MARTRAPRRDAGTRRKLLARDVRRILENPLCQGAGPIQVLAGEDFWQEDGLPFLFDGGGTVCHLVPDAGFRKESLAGSQDERLLIVDCPDEEGWLVPEDIVADWMARNVRNAALDDILLSHPLYEYLTKTDSKGHSRGGSAELVQWAPGIPNLASLYAPEFVPTDSEAPRVNRDRKAYASAVLDLLRILGEKFEVLDVELGFRFGPPAKPPKAPRGAGAA